MKRFWRPAPKCLYIVPEVHGNATSLEVILNRILPLRIFKNKEDQIIFLGDYVDGDVGSADVIDILINIKKEYKERVIFLKGNHEEYMLRAIFGGDFDFTTWINSGGRSTIDSYAKKYRPSVSSVSITRSRLQEVVPKEHIEFLQSLESFRIMDEYCFFHGSFDPNKSIAENSFNNLIHDYSGSRYTKECVAKKVAPEFKDDYVYVGAHNFNSDELYVHPRYFMLGGTAPGKLIVFELNSMECSAATRGKSRIYKHDFKIYE